jgi:hypothetical protein
MSRSICLTQIQIRNVKAFEVAFEKYSKEVSRKGEVSPILAMTPNRNVMGTITKNQRALAHLFFQPENTQDRNITPQVDASGRITNGYGVLRGDEDYIPGADGRPKVNRGVVNNINFDRLDAYYGAETTATELRDLGFNVQDYTVNDECEADFIATREVEGAEAVSAF